MDYITTNIRLPKDKYFELKEEAARRRKSLAAIMREKLGAEETESERKAAAERLMTDIRKVAKKNARYTKGFNSVKALREIRYEGKW